MGDGLRSTRRRASGAALRPSWRDGSLVLVILLASKGRHGLHPLGCTPQTRDAPHAAVQVHSTECAAAASISELAEPTACAGNTGHCKGDRRRAVCCGLHANRKGSPCSSFEAGSITQGHACCGLGAAHSEWRHFLAALNAHDTSCCCMLRRPWEGLSGAGPPLQHKHPVHLLLRRRLRR